MKLLANILSTFRGKIKFGCPLDFFLPVFVKRKGSWIVMPYLLPPVWYLPQVCSSLPPTHCILPPPPLALHFTIFCFSSFTFTTVVLSCLYNSSYFFSCSISLGDDCFYISVRRENPWQSCQRQNVHYLPLGGVFSSSLARRTAWVRSAHTYDEFVWYLWQVSKFLSVKSSFWVTVM